MRHLEQARQSQRRLAIAALLAVGLALGAGIRSSEGAVKRLTVGPEPAAGGKAQPARSLAASAQRPRRRDRRRPSSPTGLLLTETTETSVSLAWTAATDNVRVSGYELYMDGERVGTTGGTRHAFAGLGCGTGHSFAIEASDAAGNRSAPASVVAGTGACPDKTAPHSPTGLHQTTSNETGVALAWENPGGNADVVGYGIYLGGILVATTSEPAYALAGLACGATNTVAVDAVDASGNRSDRSETIVTTSRCRDATAPPAPTDLRQLDTTETSVSFDWSGSDQAGVSYGVYQNGVRVGETRATTYSLAGLVCGTSYTFAVDAYDRSGNRSAQVSIVLSTSPCPGLLPDPSPPPSDPPQLPSSPESDSQPPSGPGDVTVGARSETTVALAWADASDNVGVVGYGLYANGDLVGTTSQNSYTFAGLTCGTTYALAVDAFDAAGNRSERPSIDASTDDCLEKVPPPSDDTEAPSAPSGLVVGNATQTSVSLRWNASSDNVGVVGYRIHRDGQLSGATSQTDYVVTGLACGTSYTIAVDAYDGARNYADRTEVVLATSTCSTTDTQPPSAPDNQTIGEITRKRFTLTWSAATDNVGVTGYNVYLNDVRVATVTGTSYTYAGLTCETTYTVGVEAQDAAGNVSNRELASGSATTAACQGPPPGKDREPPTTPAGLTVTGSTLTTVSVAWNDSTDNVGVTGYGVYLGGVRIGTPAQTSYTVSGLACGTSQTVAVDAYDAAGNRSSAASVIATTTACPDTQPPSMPDSLAETSRTQTSIAVAWAPSTDNIGVVGYGLYRDGVRIGTTAQTSYTFSGLACGTTHTLGADAYDASGNRSAQATVLMTTAACSTTDTQPPSAPDNQTIGEITRTSFTLTWTASTDNVGVTGYNVYLNNVRVATVTGTSYTYAGLTCETTYTVGLEARDAAGNVSNRALASGSATTAVCEGPPGSTHQIPATIAGDCSVDVTQPILSWIASVPNNSTLSFLAGACYRIEGTLELRNRSGLAFEGNGATFRSFNAPADQRAIWRVIDSTDFVFNNMKIIGSYTNGGTLNESLQHAHAIDLRGTSVEVASVTMSDLAGDCVNMALGYTSALTRSSGSVHDSWCSRTSRNAVSLTAANDVTVTRMTTDRIGLTVFDVEPNSGPGWGSERATFDNNEIGSYYLYAFAIVQNGPVRDQAFTNNTVSGRGLRVGIVAPGGAFRPANVTITGNTSDTAEPPAAIEAYNVDGITVTGNIIPLTSGTMAAVDNTCAPSVSGNSYPGGSRELSITNTPLWCATAAPPTLSSFTSNSAN